MQRMCRESPVTHAGHESSRRRSFRYELHRALPPVLTLQSHLRQANSPIRRQHGCWSLDGLAERVEMGELSVRRQS